ncbi:MAG: tetratricopeptide repeat protein [Bacteroidaceae bacterium]|nr:tetratricopeptide repeat protein [Bacteroidaceae bacterium]
MLDLKTLRLITQNGLLNFSAGHILDGIAALRTLLPYCTSETIVACEAESLEKNYHYMLSFLRKGGDDQQRNDVQAKIQRQGAALLEQTSRAIRIQIGSDRYGKAWAYLKENFGPDIQKNVLEAFKSAPFKGEPEGERQDDLFDLLWTSPLWTPQDTAFWYDFFLGQRDMIQQHLAGALFLSAWEYHDAEKMQLLALLADSECRRTRISAVSYLLLLRLRHNEQAALLPPLPASLLTKKGRKLIAKVQYEMLLMLVSEKDMKQELEEIGQLSHDIVTGKQTLDLSNFRTLLETRGQHLRNRLKRGLDPNLSKTALLHNCKYLNRIAHWFLPFDKTHPLFQSVMIDENGNEKQNLSTLVDLILDCDTDKIATLYLVANDKDFSKAVQQFDNQELPDLENAVIPEYTFRFIMQDLYRFFGHSPLHGQLANPFREELTLLELPELTGLFTAADCISCCNLLYELERDKQVLSIVDNLIGREGASVPALMLKGQVLMHLKRYAEAQGQLRSAEILQPDNTDILQLLTECYAAQHRFEEELEYLQRLAELLPDDPSFRRLIPMTMIKAGRKEEALQLLFKLDYETTEDDPTFIAAIADTALALGKLDIAERYTQKEMETPSKPFGPPSLTLPNCSAFNGQLPRGETCCREKLSPSGEMERGLRGQLRMGHIRLLQNDWKSSIQHYEQFVNAFCKETGKDIKAALALLDSQWLTLNAQRSTLNSQLSTPNGQWSMNKDLLLIRDILQAEAEQSAKENPGGTA